MGTPGRKESPRVQVIYEYNGSMERKIGLGSSGIYKSHNINAQRVMRCKDLITGQSQRVHVGIWYILRAQRGSHIPTLRAKYTPYSYMDPLGIFMVVTWNNSNIAYQGVSLAQRVQVPI